MPSYSENDNINYEEDDYEHHGNEELHLNDMYDENDELAMFDHPLSNNLFAYQYEKTPLDYMKRLWLKFVTGSPCANRTQMGHILREIGFNPTYEEIEEHFFAYEEEEPEHSKGRVSFASLCDIVCIYMEATSVKTLEKNLIRAFRVFDDEHEGYVGTSMIANALEQLPIFEHNPKQSLLSELDPNHEGYISYESFVSNLCLMYEKGLASAPRPRRRFEPLSPDEIEDELPPGVVLTDATATDDGRNVEMSFKIMEDINDKNEEEKKKLKATGTDKQKRKKTKRVKKVKKTTEEDLEDLEDGEGENEDVEGQPKE